MGLFSLRHQLFSRRFSRKVRQARASTKRGLLLESLEHRNLLAAVPFAQDDPLYATAMNTDLVISTAGAGLVNNDSDIDGLSLSASVVANPANGTIISFNNDGTFTYRPNTSYVGADEFTYKVNNGTYDSNIATVKLQVGQVFGPRTNQDEIALGGTNFDGGNRLVQPLTLGQSLIYNSNTEPRPVVAVETSLLAGASVPTSIEAVLTFNGVSGSTVTYSTSGLSAGTPLRFVLQADGSGLATGYYDYTMTITAKYGGGDVVQTFTGSQAVVNRNASEFGRGWWYAGLDELVVNGSGALWVKSNGDALWFKNNSGTYGHAMGDTDYNALTTSGGNYLLTSKDGIVRTFDTTGELQTVVDSNGNTYSYSYTSGKLTTVTEPFGRTFTIAYSSGYATTITDYASHASTLSISSGKLNSVTLPDPDAGGGLAAPVHSFTYDGTTNLLNQYTDALSNDTAFTYNSTSKRLSQITHEDSSTWQLTPVQTIGLKTGSGNTLVNPSAAQGQITDEEGYVWRFRTDRYGNVVEFTDRWEATSYTYRNQDGLAIRAIANDPDSVLGPLTAPTTKYGYDASGNVLKILNADLTTKYFTYNGLARVLTATDELSRVTTMTYDSDGNMLTKEDNEGNEWTYTYTAAGLVDTETSPDPDGGGGLSAYVTDYNYDSYGRVTTITLPNSATQTFTYSTADLLLTATNELGKTTTNTFDALDRVLTVTLPDPDGAGGQSASTTTYAYNAMNLVTSITDPLGYVTSYTYNNRNWNTVITHPDPDGGGALSSPTETFTYLATGEKETILNSVTHPSDPLSYSVLSSTVEDSELGTVVVAYIVTWTGPDPGAEHSIQYDLMGRVVSETKHDLRTDYEYDAMSRVIEVHEDPLGEDYTTTIVYNADGQKSSITDANGHTTSWNYHDNGWLSSEISPDPDGSGPNYAPATSYSYDALGRVISITDPNGTRYIEYNFRGQQTEFTDIDPDGAGGLSAPVTQFGYDNAGQQTTVTDALSNVTTTAYDFMGRKTSVTLPDPDGGGALSAPVESYTYDLNSRLLTVTDARGGVTTFAYDNLGRKTSVTEPDPDGGGAITSGVTTNTYSARGLSVVTDALGETVTYAYDDYGNISSITDDAGKVTSITYDEYGRKETVTTPDPDGGGALTASTTTYDYDLWGRVDSVTDALGGITSYTFDAVGNLLTLTDPELNATTWSYDPLNRVAMETNELNDSRSFIYDGLGNLVRKTDRNARVTQYEFDLMSRKTAEKWYSGTSQTPGIAIVATQEGSSATQDEVQKVGYERSSGFGSMTGTFTLSFGGYTTGNISAGATAATVLTALEGLTSIGSGNVAVTKVTDTSDKQEWQITFQGSLAGANQAQVDIDITNIVNFPSSPTEIETTTTQGSGAQDEIQTVTLSNATGGTFRLAFMGQVTAPLAYNASSSTVDTALEALSTIGSGNVSVSLAGSVYTINFGGGAFDSTNVNLLQGDVSTATYGTVDRTIGWTYNANSQVTQVTDPSATIDYTLDNLSRATSIVNTINGLTPTVTFDQVFNAGSDRTQVKAKIATTNDFKTDFVYDTLGRMTDIKQQANSGNAVRNKHVTLAYNKVHQFTALNRYESTGTSNQVASTDYLYDSLHRVTDIDHKQGSTVLASYDYTYDFASRMTSVTSAADGLTDYTHDDTNQLTDADFTGQTDENYTFDDNGNRIGGSYTVTANNLTSTDGTYNYLYDDEGNRTRRTKISDSSYEEYTWDYRNRLTAVTFKNSGGTTLKTVFYEYDAFNRLLRRTYDADGPGAGAAVNAFWAFDEGINPLLEFDAAAATDVSHRYLWGPQVDQLLADEQVTGVGSAGNALWALGDNLGTIRDIADFSSGTTTVTNHRKFGAYGNLVSESNAAVDMLFAFTGKMYDEVTGLQNNLNRWYDAKLGQWVSEDPIGFEAGDPNIRRYSLNNATSLVDPRGLTSNDDEKGGIHFLQPGEKPPEITGGIIVTPVIKKGDVVDPKVIEDTECMIAAALWGIEETGGVHAAVIEAAREGKFQLEIQVRYNNTRAEEIRAKPRAGEKRGVLQGLIILPIGPHGPMPEVDLPQHINWLDSVDLVTRPDNRPVPLPPQSVVDALIGHELGHTLGVGDPMNVHLENDLRRRLELPLRDDYQGTPIAPIRWNPGPAYENRVKRILKEAHDPGETPPSATPR
jgi:RHS repeat-associated protein